MDIERIKFEVKKELLLSIKAGWNGKYDEMELVQLAQPCDICDICDILLPQLPKFCKYEKNGCEEIRMKEDMINHEQECVFREVSCPDLSCKER